MLGLKTPRPPLPLRRPRLVIGSDERAQIRLKSPDIAPRHAEIFSSPTGWQLRDLDSPSGTFVNDQRIQESRLGDQDRIRIGPFVFRFRPAGTLPVAAPGDRSLRKSPLVSPPAEKSSAAVDSIISPAAASQTPALATAKPTRTVEKAARARLRPVTGWRRRPLFPNAADLFGGAQSDPSADDADSPRDDFDEGEEELPPQTPRARVVGHFALMLVCMAVAAIMVWRLAPPTYLVRASVVFKNNSGEPLARNKAFMEQQETRFLDEPVRQAAVKLLQHPKNAPAVAIDPGFLDQPGQLRAGATFTWDSPMGRPAVATLAFILRTRFPAADAARATALVQAFCEKPKSSTRPGIAEMKIQLLQDEVNALQREVVIRSEIPQQIRKEIQALETATPSDTEILLMQKREASLRAALESAMKERIIAELTLSSEVRPPATPATKSTATSATAPAKGRTAAPVTQPASASFQATAATDSANAEANEIVSRASRVAQALQKETAVREELAQVVRELAEAQVRAASLTEQKQRLGSNQGELPRLQNKLKEKSKELAQLKKENAGIEVLALDDARVISVEDSRGMYTAIAIGSVAILFGMLMAAAARGGRESLPHRAEPS